MRPANWRIFCNETHIQMSLRHQVHRWRWQDDVDCDSRCCRRYKYSLNSGSTWTSVIEPLTVGRRSCAVHWLLTSDGVSDWQGLCSSEVPGSACGPTSCASTRCISPACSVAPSWYARSWQHSTSIWRLSMLSATRRYTTPPPLDAWISSALSPTSVLGIDCRQPRDVLICYLLSSSHPYSRYLVSAKWISFVIVETAVYIASIRHPPCRPIVGLLYHV